jgi:hypothetical protein
VYSDAGFLHGVAGCLYSGLSRESRRPNARLLQKAVYHFEKYVELSRRQAHPLDHRFISMYVDAIVSTDSEAGLETAKDFLDDLLFGADKSDPLAIDIIPDSLNSISDEKIERLPPDNVAVSDIALLELYLEFMTRSFTPKTHLKEIMICISRITHLYQVFGVESSPLVMDTAKRLYLSKALKTSEQYASVAVLFVRLLLNDLGFSNRIDPDEARKLLLQCRETFCRVEKLDLFYKILKFHRRILDHHQIDLSMVQNP